MDLTQQPIQHLAPLLRQRKLSPVELTRAFLKRIAQHNPTLNAYITVTAARALADARRSEREIRSGKYRGPLHGIPISLKDNFATKGVYTTGGSKILAKSIPENDALVARQLFAAGCILLGKTNLHEFAYGVTTENPHYGATCNPWDTKRIPGGSSGGSAAAVAAGLCCASFGTDTGGSVRIPAAHCGVVGMKTTYDLRNLQSVIPLSLSLDSVGPLARTVKDAEILLRATMPQSSKAGMPVAQANVLRLPAAIGKNKNKPLRGVVLGVPGDYFFEWIDAQVRRAVEAAVIACVKMGATVKEVAMPWIAESDDAGTSIALAEASRWHHAQGWFPQRADEYGDDVRKRLEMGMEILATDYLAAQETQRRLQAHAAEVFAAVHALVAPVTPIAATPIGENIADVCGRSEPVRGALLRLNRPANFIGLPAMSVPCGFTREGLPVGLQLIGPPCGELDLCAIARVYEQAHDWHMRRPAM